MSELRAEFVAVPFEVVARAEAAERDLEAVRAILRAQELADGTARRAALLILGHPSAGKP